MSKDDSDYIRVDLNDDSLQRINNATVKICDIFRNSNMSIQEALGTVMLLSIKLTITLNEPKESLTRTIDSNWDSMAKTMREVTQRDAN